MSKPTLIFVADRPSVRYLCAARGIAQAELARRIGIGEVHLSHALVGRRALTIEVARRLARELGVSIEEIAAAPGTRARVAEVLGLHESELWPDVVRDPEAA